MPAQPDDKSQSEKQPVSIRKVEANRRNAQRSTGPRTPRGKAHSRRNAMKHGLFIRYDVLFDEENPLETEVYYKRLRNELQPMGLLEEFEVEYIAICLLKLQRLWRYENAEVQAGQDTIMSNQENELYHPLASPTRARQMSLLHTAEKQAEESGQVSPELMKEMFSEFPSLGRMWRFYEEQAEKTAQKKGHDIAIIIAKERKMPLSEAKALLASDPKSMPERGRFITVETVREAIRSEFSQWSNLSRREIHNEYQRQLIPNDCEVDKIIRYGSAVERQLSRSYDRLEHLQRRRQGEPVPPPVSVRLTR